MKGTRNKHHSRGSIRNLILGGLLSLWLIGPGTPASAQVPPNDLCTDAITLDCGPGPLSESGDNSNSTATTAPFCGTSPGSTAVWYKVLGSGFDITIDTCSPNTVFDTKINVYTGDCTDETNLACVAGNDDAAGSPPECSLGDQNRLSRVSWTSINGVEYLIVVSGYSGASGGFEVLLSCEVPVELQQLTIE